MSWSNFTPPRVLGAMSPWSHHPLTRLRGPSSTARRPPLGSTTNGVLSRTAGHRPQGGDDVDPHPVRSGEAALRGHLRRRAVPRRRPTKHPNPGATNVRLVGVSRSFGVSRGECEACEKGHPARADHRPPRSLGRPGLHLRAPGLYLGPPGLYLGSPRPNLGPPGHARARPVRPGGPSSSDCLLQRRAVPSTAVRRSRRPRGARSTSRGGGTSARSPSTCARACRSRRG